MYICICHGVTEQQIIEAVADGVTDMQELTKSLGVASSCGKCFDCAQAYLQTPSQNQTQRTDLNSNLTD